MVVYYSYFIVLESILVVLFLELWYNSCGFMGLEVFICYLGIV